MEPGDAHGQSTFNYRHPHIRNGEEAEFLLRAFQRDFQVNGPSVVRIIRTLLTGWQRYKDHPNPRIRAASRTRRAICRSTTPAAWACRQRYRDDPHRRQLIAGVLDELCAEFGEVARSACPDRRPPPLPWPATRGARLQQGWTYEPPTFYETNSADGPPGAVRVAGISASPATVDPPRWNPKRARPPFERSRAACSPHAQTTVLAAGNADLPGLCVAMHWLLPNGPAAVDRDGLAGDVARTSLTRNATIPYSSSMEMKTPFGIGLSIISRITSSSLIPCSFAWLAICRSTRGVRT